MFITISVWACVYRADTEEIDTCATISVCGLRSARGVMACVYRRAVYRTVKWSKIDFLQHPSGRIVAADVPSSTRYRENRVPVCDFREKRLRHTFHDVGASETTCAPLNVRDLDSGPTTGRRWIAFCQRDSRNTPLKNGLTGTAWDVNVIQQRPPPDRRTACRCFIIGSVKNRTRYSYQASWEKLTRVGFTSAYCIQTRYTTRESVRVSNTVLWSLHDR